MYWNPRTTVLIKIDKVDKIDQPTFIHISSGLASNNSVQVPTGASNLTTKTVELLSETCHLKQFCKIRTSLEDRKLENIKWKKNKSSGTPSSDRGRHPPSVFNMIKELYLRI